MRFIVFFQKIRQLTQGGLFTPLLPHLLGRHTKDGLARLDVLVDGRGSQDDGPRADDQVLVDSHTAPEDDIVLDAGHASDGGMGTDEAVMADIAVVADLAVVVQLGAALDDGVGGDAAVDAAQGTDLHVVGDDHTAERLELLEAFVTALEIIAVRPDDAARVDDDVVANHAVVVDSHIGMDEAVLPDDGVMSDKATRHNERALPYLGRFADGLRLWLEGTKMPHDTQKSVKRVVMEQQGLAFRADHFLINKDHRCGRVERLGVVFRVVDEGDVARLHLVDFVQASDGEIGRANIFGANEFRYVFQGSLLDFHGNCLFDKMQK